MCDALHGRRVDRLRAFANDLRQSWWLKFLRCSRPRVQPRIVSGRSPSLPAPQAAVTAQAGWVGDPEELLTVGLLHSAGDLALLCQFPEEYLAAEAGESGSVSAVGPLRSVLGVDSGTAGQWLLDGWLFPSIFGTSCRYWPDPFSTGVEECYRPAACGGPHRRRTSAILGRRHRS